MYYPTITASDSQLLHQKPVSKQLRKSLRKKIAASKNFQICGNSIRHSSGDRVPAIACWKSNICVDDGYHKARFARIQIIYLDTVYLYAIPIELRPKNPSFPGLQFSCEEVALLYKIADIVSPVSSHEEKYLAIGRQERIDASASRKLAGLLPSDEATVAEIIRDAPWVLEVMEATLLANLRPWLFQNVRPNHLVAFVAPLRSGQPTRTALTQLLSACNFTSNPSAQQLVELSAVSSNEDLLRWEQAGCRIVLLTVREGGQDKLIQRAEEIQLSRTTNVTVSTFEGQPLLWTRGKYPPAIAHNISLPELPPPWSEAQLDAIRSFVGKLLAHPKRLAKTVSSQYLCGAEGAYAYRTSTITAWLAAAEDIIHKGLHQHCEAVKVANESLRKEAEYREELLGNTVAKILCPAQYVEQISTTWPETKEGVLSLLDKEEAVVALHRSTSKVDFLAFTKTSMSRLCEQFTLPPEDFPLVLDRLKALGFLGSDTAPIRLSDGSTLRMVRLETKFCDDFKVVETPVTKEGFTHG